MWFDVEPEDVEALKEEISGRRERRANIQIP
jgi:hypothetical protein